MADEPAPLFPTGTPAPRREPAPAFAPGRQAATPRPASAPSPAFAAKAEATPVVMAVVEAMFAGEGEDAVRRAKRLAAGLDAIPAGDARGLAEFGREAQAAAGRISEDLLAIVRVSPDALLRSLSGIRGRVAAVKGSDLLDGSLTAALTRRLLPADELIASAVHEVGRLAEAADREMPGLEARAGRIGALAAEERRCRATLEDHVRALEAVLRHRSGRDGTEDLEERLASLRMTLVVGATDAAQVVALREQTARLAAAARHITGNLVGLWRRQCAAALAALEARRTEGLTARERAADGLEGARERLVAALDAALGSGR